MEKFIMADHCALRIRDSIKGEPAVVLLHGYLESIEVWEEFIPLLDGVRTLAVDLPGHGISEVKGPVHSMEFLARTVRAAMHESGVEKAFIVGHSMGGYVALEFLKLFPQAVAGIVLLHSTPNADSPEKRELRKREEELVLAGKKESIAKLNPQARFAAVNHKRLHDWIEDLADEVFLIEDDGIVALLRGMAERQDNNLTLRKSNVPQLLIFGRADEHITPEAAQTIIDSHPQAKVVWLENSGHMGFIEEPQLVADAILSFIK